MFEVDGRDLLPGDLVVMTEFDLIQKFSTSLIRTNHCLVISTNSTETAVDVLYLVPGSGLARLNYKVSKDVIYVPFSVLARSEKE